MDCTEITVEKHIAIIHNSSKNAKWWFRAPAGLPRMRTQRNAQNIRHQSRKLTLAGLTLFSKSISSFSFPMRSSLSWWAFSNLTFSWRSLASSWKTHKRTRFSTMITRMINIFTSWKQCVTSGSNQLLRDHKLLCNYFSFMRNGNCQIQKHFGTQGAGSLPPERNNSKLTFINKLYTDHYIWDRDGCKGLQVF